MLVHDPKVLLLDEPASGLDPRARVEIRQILKELRRMKKTILISSHILSELSEICNRVGIIEKGKLIIAGTVDEVLHRIRGGRSVRVVVTNGDREKAVKALEAWDGATAVTEEEDASLLIDLRDGEVGAPEIAALLVGAGIGVRRLEEEKADLEEAFMKLTEGIVS